MSYHDEVNLGYIHIVPNWVYANEAARQGATGLTSDDIYKAALQSDNNSLWLLVNNSPVEWVAISGNTILDGYAHNETVDTHYKEFQDFTKHALLAMDGYSLDNTEIEHYVQHSNAIQTILKDLDGYSSTEAEHYVQHSDAIQTILKDLDGYVEISGSPTENFIPVWTNGTNIKANPHMKDNGASAPGTPYIVIGPSGNLPAGYEVLTIKGALGIDPTGLADAGENGQLALFGKSNGCSDRLLMKDIAGKEHIISVTGDLDGYSVTSHDHDTNYAFADTEAEHYAQMSQAVQDIIGGLDGYVSGAGYVTIATELEHYQQHSDAIQSIIKDLDGYGATATTEAEHYNQHSDAIQTIVKDLDGYWNTGSTGSGNCELLIISDDSNKKTYSDSNLKWNQEVLTLSATNFAGDGSSLSNVIDSVARQNWIDTSQQLQDIRDTLIDGYTFADTEAEHYTQHSDAIQTILKSLDGYTSASGYVSVTTELEHYNQHSDAIQSIIKDLDGYASESVEDQRWIDSSQQLQDVRDSLDGYITSIGDGVSESTFQEFKAGQSEINNDIITELDGYASAITEAEHYNQHSDAIQTIIKDLDGYALDGYVTLGNSSFIVDDDGYMFANKAIHTAGGDIYLPTSAVIVDFSLSNSQAVDLSAISSNCAIDFAGGVEGGSYMLYIHQHPTSEVTVTFGEDILFSGGAPPTITATADAIDIISVGYRFGKWFASWIGDFKRTS